MIENSINSSAFDFEINFNHTSSLEWMGRHSTTPFYWAILYVILIFGGKQWMKDRDPFPLRNTLFIWNLCLAVFSIVGTLRVLVEMLDLLVNHGFGQSVCNNGYITHEVSAFWAWIYTLSKVVELGDTMFIVLRKQRLMFLHWYHHFTVLLFSWYGYSHKQSVGRWFLTINFTIHSIMYSYYAIKALRIRIPKSVSSVITSAQIIQMIFGLFVIYYAFYMKSKGNSCQTSDLFIFWSICIYLSYFVLFTDFFIKSYLRSPKESNKKIQ